MNDTIVEEVRDQRRKIMESFHWEIEAMIRNAIQRQDTTRTISRVQKVVPTLCETQQP